MKSEKKAELGNEKCFAFNAVVVERKCVERFQGGDAVGVKAGDPVEREDQHL